MAKTKISKNNEVSKETVEIKAEEKATDQIEEISEENLSKKEKKARKKKIKKKLKSNWTDFKKFVSKGNAFDMAIGVVLGGAFTAIVSALTSILLNLVTWPTVGGLDSLITVLPAAGKSQAGLTNIGQTFASSKLHEMAQIIVDMGIKSDLDKAETHLLNNYKLYGSTYVYNGAAVINWGAFINAMISFVIIAVVLFLILKMVVAISKAAQTAQEKALEEYYKKHPDERPVIKEKEPDKSEKELLKEILNIMKLKNADLLKKENEKIKKIEEKKTSSKK